MIKLLIQKLMDPASSISLVTTTIFVESFQKGTTYPTGILLLN